MNFWERLGHSLTLGYFDNRVRSNPTTVRGITIDDPSGDNNKFTEVDERGTLEKYDRMRKRDSQLRALTRNTKLPIRSGNYMIEAEDEEVAEFCKRQVGLSAVQNNIDWDQLLIDVLSYMDFGFYVAETQKALIDNKYIELVGIHLRPAETITEFYLKDGKVTGVEQDSVEGVVPITDNIFHIAFESEGNNPKGQSLLEACVTDYDAKQNYIRYSQLNAKRFAVGVPVINHPREANVEEKNSYVTTLRNYAEGKNVGMILPDDVTMSVIALQGGERFDVLPLLRYHDQAMSKAYLSQVIELGSTETGSRAVGDDFTKAFYYGLTSLADQICKKITDDLLTPLVVENFGKDIQARLVCDNLVPQNDSQSLEWVLKYITEGVIMPDEAQREHILEWLKLPQGEGDMPDMPLEEKTRLEMEAKEQNLENQRQQMRESRNGNNGGGGNNSGGGNNNNSNRNSFNVV